MKGGYDDRRGREMRDADAGREGTGRDEMGCLASMHALPANRIESNREQGDKGA